MSYNISLEVTLTSCYASGLAKMAKEFPKLAERVQNDKIDRRQGSEFDIVIVDLTRTRGAGFMKNRNRLDLLLSRAKNGLYVMGNKPWIDSLNRQEGKFLLKF